MGYKRVESRAYTGGDFSAVQQARPSAESIPNSQLIYRRTDTSAAWRLLPAFPLFRNTYCYKGIIHTTRIFVHPYLGRVVATGRGYRFSSARLFGPNHRGAPRRRRSRVVAAAGLGARQGNHRCRRTCVPGGGGRASHRMQRRFLARLVRGTRVSDHAWRCCMSEPPLWQVPWVRLSTRNPRTARLLLQTVDCLVVRIIRSR